jgi:hypothetical protein
LLPSPVQDGSWRIEPSAVFGSIPDIPQKSIAGEDALGWWV